MIYVTIASIYLFISEMISVENEIIKHVSCWSIWGSGSIKIEFGMSKNPCMQNMSFVAAWSVELWRVNAKKLQKLYIII